MTQSPSRTLLQLVAFPASGQENSASAAAPAAAPAAPAQAGGLAPALLAVLLPVEAHLLDLRELRLQGLGRLLVRGLPLLGRVLRLRLLGRGVLEGQLLLRALVLGRALHGLRCLLLLLLRVLQRLLGGLCRLLSKLLRLFELRQPLAAPDLQLQDLHGLGRLDAALARLLRAHDRLGPRQARGLQLLQRHGLLALRLLHLGRGVLHGLLGLVHLLGQVLLLARGLRYLGLAGRDLGADLLDDLVDVPVAQVLQHLRLDAGLGLGLGLRLGRLCLRLRRGLRIGLGLGLLLVLLWSGRLLLLGLFPLLLLLFLLLLALILGRLGGRLCLCLRLRRRLLLLLFSGLCLGLGILLLLRRLGLGLGCSLRCRPVALHLVVHVLGLEVAREVHCRLALHCELGIAGVQEEVQGAELLAAFLETTDCVALAALLHEELGGGPGRGVRGKAGLREVQELTSPSLHLLRLPGSNHAAPEGHGSVRGRWGGGGWLRGRGPK
mmetsp:Transcript_43299/g.133813  ORF Transcript_43299/g.133813 Transcript_43299/m.133813 type:complete len:493 (-) Transcript_43299:8-1486(-)